MTKKALRLSAFFIASSLVVVTAWADCRTRNYDVTAQVKRIVDGDTLVLTDKSKVRLIGINTPELGHYQNLSEPFALQARQFVAQQLEKNKKIKLKFAADKKDRYGRLLAHVFLSNGKNLNAMLVKNGLASAIVVPPNLKLTDCYFKLEQQARKKKKNMWSGDVFSYQNADILNKTDRGFKFIKGKVIRVGQSRDSIWLQMTKKFTVRIKRKDFKYFKNINLQKLRLKKIKNRIIKIRGWVYNWKGDLYMQVRHPLMINGL